MQKLVLQERNSVKEVKFKNSVTVLQSICWDCGRLWSKAPGLERHGLRCLHCGTLNYYNWSLKEYRAWKKLYKKLKGGHR